MDSELNNVIDNFLGYAKEQNLEMIELALTSKKFKINQTFTKEIYSNEKHLQGITLLHYASWKGKTKLVQMLIQKADISVNKSTITGITPLMRAAFYGHYEIVEALINHPKINLNKRNGKGNTALDMAIYKGHMQVASLIEEADGR